MKTILLVLSFFLLSCAMVTQDGPPKEGKTTYSFADVSGNYSLEREVKLKDKKIITRSRLVGSDSQKTLEKSITVSQLGTIKVGSSKVLIVRPFASEFTIWLEAKKYFSRMQLNPESRSIRVEMESPEPKWNGAAEVAFPKGKYFCFYSQIPECLYHAQLLSTLVKQPKKSESFYVIWDSYPYLQEQFTGLGKDLFSRAKVKFDGEMNKNLRFMVEIEGQTILYHFSKSFDFLKMAWIAQGITIVPPGEEAVDEEQ